MFHIFKWLFALTFLLFISPLTARSADNRPLLTDNETGEPLVVASISDKNGNVIALTGNDGTIPELPANSFPVTFSYIGYTPLEVSSLNGENVGLTPAPFGLSEVVVSPGGRPLMHIRGYMREFSSLFGQKDTFNLYIESEVDFLIPVAKTKNKGWRSPRILASKAYERHTNADGLDSVSSQPNQLSFLASSLTIFPSGDSYLLKIPDKIAAATGMASETVVSEHKDKMDWQRNGSVIRLIRDPMNRYENHVCSPNALKLLGATTDFTEMLGSYVFIKNDTTAEISPADLSQISLSLKMTGKGKIYKWAFNLQPPLGIQHYFEVYLTDKEYLTEEEAKNIKKNPPAVAPSEIVAPAQAPVLHSGIQKMVERIELQNRKFNH